MKPYYEDDAVTIYHGDARELLADVLPPEQQCWLTDPPYSSGGFQEAGKGAGSIGRIVLRPDETIANDTLSTRGYTNLMRDVLRYSQAAQEIGVFTDWRMWTTTSDALEYAGFMLRAMVVWSKGKSGIGRPWRNAHELIAYGMRVQASKDRIAKASNVIECSRSRNENHPTEKPLALITQILENMEGALVVDPFAGSGTTLVAAKALGRRAIGVEYDERYCEIAAERCAQEVLDFGQAA